MSVQKRKPPRHIETPSIRSSNAYEQFLKGVQLVNLVLEHCHADVDRLLYSELKESNTLREVAAKYELFYSDEDSFTAFAFFELCVSNPKRKKKEALSIDCSFATHFHCFDADRKYIKQFVGSELRLIVWPYFRQLVNDLSARMVVDLPIIPLSEPE